jgi:site-specific recombinase XerD
MLTLFRRHLKSCKHREKGWAYRHCQCPLAVQGTLRGEKIRRALDMRSWEGAQDLLREWESRGPKTALVSVEDAAKRFIEDAEARKLSPVTLGKHKFLLGRLSAFARSRGVKYISQVRSEDLMKFRAEWTDSPVSAAKKLERLRSFFRFCHAMKWIEDDPAVILKAPKFQIRPTMPFTDEEWDRILAATDRYPTKNTRGYDNRARLRAFVLALRYSGLRIGDVVALRKERISNGTLFLRTAKTGQPVRVPLPLIALQALEKCGGGEYVFWTGNGLLKSAVADWQRSLRRLFKLAGVEGHAHMFRDTLATDLLTKGVPLEAVAAILGNSVKVCERHYAPWVKARQDALETAVKSTWRSEGASS